ncbi:sensor histidine kinase, HAMP domain-containing [Geobacter metallireducens GS-15]|uniref:histidine kinase n=2 Tax=Geobacter metallireducens TaxID=28232 RepID=Q39V26_GEOMG|nr:sensor histidine kinase, HAMP domain-containing [Geobacter metallireducens GS-15]
MRIFRQATIKRKMMLISMATTGVALLISGVVLIFNEMVSYRRSLVNSLTVQARITGSNSTAALSFNNPRVAHEMLGALSAAPNIVQATIHTREGEVFARYLRTGERVKPISPPPKNGYSIAANSIVVVEPIILDQEPIGTILIESDLRELHGRLGWYTAIMVIVFSGSLWVAFLLLSRMQRAVTSPILDLVQVMGTVSREGDYSVRASAWNDDELGSLAQGFNEMLVQIQSRDNELELHRRHLEQTVASRTAELADANEQLQRELVERQRAEEQLQRYSGELRDINDELKSFAYMVSHDLRAPLINIKGFASELDLALKDAFPLLEQSLTTLSGKEREQVRFALQQDAPEALGFISSSVNRMDALINAVLQLSYIGRREIRLETVCVTTIVNSILQSLRHQLEQRSVTVTVGELPEIIIDKMALEQIIGNLLDNAVKYLAPERPGRIEVNAYEEADGTTLRISDNGRGIAPGDMGKVFELFRRGNCPDTVGEGMGLAYVKTLVRRFGGRIECESIPGVGTTFSVFIPIQSYSGKEYQ